MNLLINNLSYCAVSAIYDSKKVLYIQKFPPVNGTDAPKMHTQSTSNDLDMNTLSKSDVIDFWNNEDSFQSNGNWKGGKWGKNNLCTTDATWLSGAFIGDEITLTKVADGIIKFNGGKRFTSDMPILPNTEGLAWSCNTTYYGIDYGVYVTNNIMPQIANDVLFIWENSKGQQFIKLLTRGYNDNVDMPRRMMPGAGEHMEPGKDIKVKDGVIRAINEEIGIPESTLTDCYLLNLWTYNEEGRDPRYWTYSVGSKSFGMKRGSETNAYILYLKSDNDAAPKEVNPSDTEEVNSKWWAPLSTVLTDYPDDRWMIIDHKKFIPDAIMAINNFKNLSPEQKICSKFIVS
jgi:hypothetical protein